MKMCNASGQEMAATYLPVFQNTVRKVEKGDFIQFFPYKITFLPLAICHITFRVRLVRGTAWDRTGRDTRVPCLARPKVELARTN